MEATHNTDELQKILGFAQQIGEPRIWLGPLVGRKGDDPGPYLQVADLHTVLSGHPEPKVVLAWDGDKTLEVKKTDGGVMATFELKF